MQRKAMIAALLSGSCAHGGGNHYPELKRTVQAGLASSIPPTQPTSSPGECFQVRWPAYLGLGVSIAGVAAGTIFAFAAVRVRDSAHGYYRTDPRLAQARDEFLLDRAGWIASFGIATLGAALSVSWTITHPATTTSPRIDAHVGDGDLLLRATWPM